MSVPERQRRYNATEKGKARYRRYRQTEKGKARDQRWIDSGKLAEHNARRVTVNGMYLGKMGFTESEREELLRHGKAE